MGILRILVGTDFSDHAHQAMRHAIALAGSTGAEIRVVHAVPTNDVPSYAASVLAGAAAQSGAINQEGSIHLWHCWKRVPVDRAGAVESNASIEKSAEELGSAMSAPYANRPSSVVFLQREGTDRYGIQEQLAAESYDMVVMGSHGRTGLSRWLMGSVTEATIRHSPVPVYVVRGKP